MIDTLLALVPEYGLWLIGFATFLSCLALPAPASLLMLAGGAFAAGGDLSLIGTAAAAYAGAIAGDQTGFVIGRRGAGWLRIDAANGKRGRLVARARDFIGKWGHLGVFLSRWLVSPLGPYVNFLGGAAGLAWTSFSVGSAAGEAVWVGLYTGLGYAFAGQIQMVADMASSISGFIAAGVVTLGLGLYLFRRENGAGSSQDA